MLQKVPANIDKILGERWAKYQKHSEKICQISEINKFYQNFV